MEEDKIYVVVGKEVEDHKSVLIWALQNSGGKTVCIIHVHQPDKHIPTPIGYMPAEKVTPAQLKAHRDEERRIMMSKILDKYLQISEKSGVSLEKLYIEDDSIEKGIIQLIEQYKIKKLVMRSATDRQYNKRMTELRSRKAIYVRDNAPPSCLIWFVCKGFLIHTRKPIAIEKDPTNVEGNGLQPSTASAPPFNAHEEIPERWSFDTYKDIGSSLVSRSNSGRSEAIVATRGLEPSRDSIEGTSNHQSSHFSIHQSFISRNNELSNGLQTMYIEECRRRKEVETELAIVKQELEWMKNNEAKLPKAMVELDYMTNQVEELTKVKTELNLMKTGVLGELRSAIEQKALLENQIRNFTVLLEMLGEKLASAINLVHNYGEQ